MGSNLVTFVQVGSKGNAPSALLDELKNIPDQFDSEIIGKMKAASVNGPVDVLGIVDSVVGTSEQTVSQIPVQAGTSVPVGTKKPGFLSNITDRVKPFFTGRWIKIAAYAIIGILVLLIVIWFLGKINRGSSYPSALVPSESAQPGKQINPFSAPEQPQILVPVDLASSTWFSPVQIMIILSILLIGFANYRDAKQRGQIADFWDTIIGTIKIVAVGLVVMVTKGIFEGKYATTDQLYFWVSLVMIIWAFEQVWQASKQGGKDFTPLGDLLINVAGWGLIFGTLGAFEYVFSIPRSPILPLYQVQTLFVLKQYSQIYMSLAVYALLAGGVFIYGEEVIRLVTKLTDTKEVIGTILSSFVGLVAYPSVRILLGWTPIQSFLAALALTMITGLVAVRTGAVSPLTSGETRTSNAVIIPWDKLAFQLAVGLLAITLLGRV